MFSLSLPQRLPFLTRVKLLPYFIRMSVTENRHTRQQIGERLLDREGMSEMRMNNRIKRFFSSKKIRVPKKILAFSSLKESDTFTLLYGLKVIPNKGDYTPLLLGMSSGQSYWDIWLYPNRYLSPLNRRVRPSCQVEWEWRRGDSFLLPMYHLVRVNLSSE